MSRLRIGIVIALVGGLAALGAGCGGDNGGSGGTTAPPATTAATTTAATTTEPTTTEPTTTEPATTAATTTAAPAGDVAAGKTFFEGTCQTCHLSGGTQAGVGPVLAATGLTAARIREQVVNGGGAMPPGLASGDDLDNVVAFVVSIQ